MTPPKSPRPRAFRLDDPNVVLPGQPAPETEKPRVAARPAAETAARIIIEAQPDPYAREAAAAVAEEAEERSEAIIETAQREGLASPRRFTWWGLLSSAIGGLITLSLGLWIDQLVEDLFHRSAALGYVGLACAAAAGAALAVLLARETASIVRQSGIARLHAAIAAARAGDDREAARRHVLALAQLYAKRPQLARVRAELEGYTREIIDGRDLIDIAERCLMQSLDVEVRREIAAAAKRVSLVTAMSPRALFDVLFVAAQAMYLMRKIAEIYGGRPGLFGFLKLARSVGSHIAITGGMAVGDSIVQQFLGHGVASRISARLGEGVLNGLLTARIGLSAMAVCRPMPFGAERPPQVTDVAPFLFTSKKA